MTTEPPYADPLVRWCGRAEPVRVPPMPIALFSLSLLNRLILVFVVIITARKKASVHKLPKNVRVQIGEAPFKGEE